jgi:endonuclease III
MNETAIRDRLVEKGRSLFEAPKEKLIEFIGDPAADALLNDLDKRPHAFVLACLMDRLVDYKRAWLVPYKISQKLKGEFSIEVLSQLSPEKVKQLMSGPPPLIPFFNKMSDTFYRAVKRIANVYEGNAARMWTGRPPSAEAVYRFLEFDGVGPKIATMAVNILARDFKVKFADFYSIDISADVHVSRVFSRLGLCTADPTVEQVVYKARAINLDYPGIIDLPCWEIGEYWCRPHNPQCTACYMKDLCPTANASPPPVPSREG